MSKLTNLELLAENRKRLARGEKLLPIEKPKDLVVATSGKTKDQEVIKAPKHSNVKEEEKETERSNVVEEKAKNKRPLFDEEKNRNFKPKNYEEQEAFDTALAFDDICSLGNYLKWMKILGLSLFLQVKNYVKERDKIKHIENKGAYFTTMARLEHRFKVISHPKKLDDEQDKKVDKK